MRPQFSNQLTNLALFMALLFVSVFVSAGNVWAETFDEMYGPELKSVPYALRVRYSNEYEKTWSEATYDERRDFLIAVQEEEMEEAVAQQTRDIEQSLIETQKAMELEAKKLAQQQKEMDKQMIKDNKKLEEEMKKYDIQSRSEQQKLKILMMRSQQR